MASSFQALALSSPRTYKLSGELDVSTAPRLMEAIRDDCQGRGDITLDLGDVTFLDSSGIHVLLSTCKQLESKGTLILRNPSTDLRHVLDLAGVEDVKGLRIDG